MNSFYMVLVEPEIPPNTGNVIRLCANVGAELHLIHPLGFQIDDKQLRRAGLDYHQHISIREHSDYSAFLKAVKPQRIFAIETSGKRLYTDPQFVKGDVFLFGSETRGLSESILNTLPKENILRLPMKPNIRSINLSNTVAIVAYEAWRQLGFEM
jgi:tRNA (cytidine/uridine-2'-O-)-methyltransferase